MVLPALIIPIILGRPIYILLLLAVLFVHNSLGGIGAVALWEYKSVDDFANKVKDPEVHIPIVKIKDIKIGKGWERNGLWLVIPYVIPLINIISKDICISFTAYDEITNKDVVYAFLLADKNQVKDFMHELEKHSALHQDDISG